MSKFVKFFLVEHPVVLERILLLIISISSSSNIVICNCIMNSMMRLHDTASEQTAVIDSLNSVLCTSPTSVNPTRWAKKDNRSVLQVIRPTIAEWLSLLFHSQYTFVLWRRQQAGVIQRTRMKGVWTLESDQNSAHAVLIFCPGYNFEISFLVLTLKW